MSSHHDSHDNDSSIWKVLNVLLAAAFAIFTLVAGLALIKGGYDNSRAHGKPAVDPNATASAPAGGAAAPTAAVAAPATGAAPTTGAAPATTAPVSAAATAAPGGAAEFTIRPGAANPMSFDITSISVKAGQKVKITFSNDGSVPLQHNLIVCKAGSKDRMMALANTMMTDMGKWLPLGFVPDSPDVIAHTKLLNMKESETIEFTAPAEKGDYPYLCTFPGHSMIMNGTMKVE